MSDRRSHSHAHSSALATAQGIRAIKISAVGLLATAAVQLAIVAVGRSAGLFADALHNLSDVFTTVALWIAFHASRRAATRRYTFGYDRFEDLAGVGIVVVIGVSAVLAGWESYRAFVEVREVAFLEASLVAAFIGVVGNEVVARYKIKVGRQIRSAALAADGRHARIDALVSAGAVAGLAGVALGFPAADPVAGMLITAAIVWITVTSAREVAARLTDAVDEEVIGRIEELASSIDGVREVHDVKARWAGRSLFVQLHICVDEDLPLNEAHAIGEEVRHEVIDSVEGVSQALVHLDPWGEGKDQSVYHPARHRHDDPDHPH